LLVPLINESEKLDLKLESQLTVLYFMASEELRKADEEHRKRGPPIGPAIGHFPSHSVGTIDTHDGKTDGNGYNKMENEQSGARNDIAMPNMPNPLQGQRRPMPIFSKLYLGEFWK
jgi:hypothetical protein